MAGMELRLWGIIGDEKASLKLKPNPRSKGRSMITASRALLALAFSYVISCSGFLSVLGIQSSKSISSYGMINYAIIEYGFNVHDPFHPKILGTGAKWVRIGVDIAVTPPWSHGQNAKEMINGYREQGFKILAILTYGGSAPWTGVSREFNLYDWRMKIRSFVDAFASLIDAYEIWNEPDSKDFQWGYMDGTPQRYFDMLKVAYEEIKARDPLATVIAGSLMDFNDWGPGSGGYFLAEIWKLGAAAYCDAVSIHVYDYLLLTYTASGAVELINYLTNKPVWITEIGATSTDKKGFSGVPPGKASEETQRDWMRQKFSDLEAGRVKPKVVMWYIFYEYPENAFSVVNLDYTEKLSYYTFIEFSSS